MIKSAYSRLRGYFRRLRDDASAVAFVEFAYATPVVLVLGAYGIELANFAVTNMRVSQAALALADNASRAGVGNPLSLIQVQEREINEVLLAAGTQTSELNLLTNGRVVLSSLQVNDSDGDGDADANDTNQIIKWQRCKGLKNYNSTYGVQGDIVTAMGPPGQQISSPPGTAVMFVEVTYDYQPVIGAAYIGSRQIHYTAAFTVRDQRDLTGLYNSAPAAVASTCDRYTTT